MFQPSRGFQLLCSNSSFPISSQSWSFTHPTRSRRCYSHLQRWHWFCQMHVQFQLRHPCSQCYRWRPCRGLQCSTRHIDCLCFALPPHLTLGPIGLNCSSLKGWFWFVFRYCWWLISSFYLWKWVWIQMNWVPGSQECFHGWFEPCWGSCSNLGQWLS